MLRDGIKGQYILLRGDTETRTDDTYATKDKGVQYMLNMLNRPAYNEPIIPQEYMVCFHIFEEEKHMNTKTQ